MKIVYISTLCLCLLSIGGLMHYIVRQWRLLNAYKLRAADRLRYIQTLMETGYKYKHAPSHMAEHLYSEMGIEKILSYHIVDDDCDKTFPIDCKCRRSDKLLYILYENGFSARELCVIFALNNMNAVYVKYNRLNKKLNKEEEGEEPQ